MKERNKIQLLTFLNISIIFSLIILTVLYLPGI